MWLEVKQPTDAIWLAAGSLLGKPILRLRGQPRLKRFVGHLEGSATYNESKEAEHDLINRCPDLCR